ncbi:MAG: LysR substrate-binding domain-containing protein [Acidobacteriaceae bacterium]
MFAEPMENFRLKVFRAVAAHLNFRRAAEDLLLTQPAVTQQIQALEEEIGTALFDRTGGRVKLTGSGEILRVYAERLSALAEEALEAIAANNGNAAGELAVGASQTNSQYVLPRLLGAFHREYPGLKIRIVSHNTEDVLEALVQRQIGVALIEGPALRRDVRTQPFLEDELLLVTAPDHPWAGKQMEPEMLRTQPMLMRERGSGSRRVVEQALAKAGIHTRQLNILMALDSTEGLVSGVEAGLGFAFISQWAVRNQLRLRTLATAKIKGVRITRMLSVAYPAGPVPSGLNGKFLRFMTMRAQDVLLQSLHGTRASIRKGAGPPKELGATGSSSGRQPSRK